MLGPDESKELYVFPSSNGLFFPNTFEVFQREIVEEDKYEWEGISCEPLQDSKRLFLRDIHKQWYLRGVSRDLPSVDSIIELVRQQSKYKKVRLVGSSAGGYLSVILGLSLNAEFVLSFSGQFQLDATARDDPIENTLVVNNLDSKYHRLNFLFEKNCTTPIFYFVGEGSERDQIDAKIAGSFRNVFVFRLRSEIHGVPFLPFVLKYLIVYDVDRLKSLHTECDSVVLTPLHFALKVCGWRVVLLEYTKLILKKN